MTISVDTQVKEVIIEHLGVETEKVTNNATFVQDLDVDSLDAMDLLLGMNEEFDIKITPEQLDQIHSVQDMINTVKAELAKKVRH